MVCGVTAVLETLNEKGGRLLLSRKPKIGRDIGHLRLKPLLRYCQKVM